MRRSTVLLSALVIASSITIYQEQPAQAGMGKLVGEVPDRGGRAIRDVTPDRIRVRPGTVQGQVESCINGHRNGSSETPLPTTRNICARMRR